MGRARAEPTVGRARAAGVESPGPRGLVGPGVRGVERVEPRQTYALTVSGVDTRFVTEDHFIAGVEMQLSGEPLAQAMGRDLGGFVRDYTCQTERCSPDAYRDPTADDDERRAFTDLAGFSSAVESYEYSKQPMNNLAFESGAGTSLLFGPVLNPSGARGAGALRLARDWYVHMAGASGAQARFVKTPGPSNPLGWPGLWPVLQPFVSWDPAIQPTREGGCSISSDDNPGAKGALTCAAYECDDTSLHLPDRTRQVSMTIGPGASGWFDWKAALWTLNYLQTMHGSKEQAVESVSPSQLAQVGIPGNAVIGHILAGTYLGSSAIEGFQAGNFLQMLDNQAAQWLSQLTTSDGSSLGGFASVTDALGYGPRAPLRWFPSTVWVTEMPDPSGFPRPARYAIASAGSHLLDLAGLVGAYASVYALTDRTNAEVGGSQPALAYFDGDPFPSQNQKAEGRSTLHDRALAMVRVAVANIDRIHADLRRGLFHDDAEWTPRGFRRGTRISTDVAAYALVALRTARRALDSQLTLYGNARPDTHGIPTPLDPFPYVRGVSFGAEIDRLIDTLARLLFDRLTTAAGVAFGGWDTSAPIADSATDGEASRNASGATDGEASRNASGATDGEASGGATDAGDRLDAHTAAIRGLLAAYLALGEPRYRDRALAVFARVESAFYDPAARVYRDIAGERALQVTFTARRFALLQASLRDVYELIATLPGQILGPLIEARLARLNKLVLNGWDDRNEDETIDWPAECAHLGAGPDGHPMGLGALQMGERVLTGESGSTSPADALSATVPTDREHDCVPEIGAARLPAALADSVTFTLSLEPSGDADLPPEAGAMMAMTPALQPPGAVVPALQPPAAVVPAPQPPGAGPRTARPLGRSRVRPFGPRTLASERTKVAAARASLIGLAASLAPRQVSGLPAR